MKKIFLVLGGILSFITPFSVWAGNDMWEKIILVNGSNVDYGGAVQTKVIFGETTNPMFDILYRSQNSLKRATTIISSSNYDNDQVNTRSLTISSDYSLGMSSRLATLKVVESDNSLNELNFSKPYILYKKENNQDTLSVTAVSTLNGDISLDTFELKMLWRDEFNMLYNKLNKVATFCKSPAGEGFDEVTSTYLNYHIIPKKYEDCLNQETAPFCFKQENDKLIMAFRAAWYCIPESITFTIKN